MYKENSNSKLEERELKLFDKSEVKQVIKIMMTYWEYVYANADSFFSRLSPTFQWTKERILHILHFCHYFGDGHNAG